MRLSLFDDTKIRGLAQSVVQFSNKEDVKMCHIYNFVPILYQICTIIQKTY